MAIPDFQSIMLPLLQQVSDGRQYSSREVTDILAVTFTLTSDERGQLLPSGLQATFDNRVAWAKSHLKMAGLVESQKRGFFNITSRGRDVLAAGPSRIDLRTLRQYPDYLEAVAPKKENNEAVLELESTNDKTPEEYIEFGYQKIRTELELEILSRVKSCSPSFFERLVVELLVKMGYGGSRFDAGRAVGKSGDGGIDGIIKEDKLGLDAIYLQAKKWEGTVGRPEIQKFAGALQGQRARKGVFITTSNYSDEARDYVAMIESKIVLIDGQELARLMIDHQVGVSTVATYELKKIDSDYFTDE
jgi:restriction system protein